MLVLAAYIGLDLIAVISRRSKITRYPGAIIPALLLSGLALILIDNFTYTIFRFGISTSAGGWRGVYGLLFILLSIFIFIQMLQYFGLRGKESPKKLSSNRLFYFSLGILVLSTGLAASRLDFKKLTSAEKTAVFQQTTRYPNIILLGSDGVSAKNMSVYGYERDTTPILRELAKRSLVAENAFTNSGNTPGSVFSLLTGKLPTTTRVGFSPDILTGLDAFQHLPGILKSAGYKTVEFGIPVFLDAYSFNMQNAFDMVDGRSQSSGKLGTILQKLGYENAAYFMDNLTGRISDRIQHIFYLRDMQNPIELVTRPADSLSDNEKIDQMLDLFDQSEQPLFVHVHLMGTHGVKFAPSVQVFSKGEKQDQTWMVDYYDDAILAFDHSIGEVIDHLKASGQYENTILIIYSDHDMQWKVNQHIPLIIHFPADGYARQVSQNVQNLDIAPTVLDYLGLAEPDWMGGESLLKSNPDSHRLIFAMGTIQATQSNGSGERFINPELIKPPFYQFGYVNIIDCQKWYRFNLETLKWTSGDVLGNIDPCPQQNPLSFDEIKQEMVQRLVLDGFDTSSLP
jgi:arylsulfatase A-like enzyme